MLGILGKLWEIGRTGDDAWTAPLDVVSLGFEPQADFLGSLKRFVKGVVRAWQFRVYCSGWGSFHIARLPADGLTGIAYKQPHDLQESKCQTLNPELYSANASSRDCFSMLKPNH